MWENLRRFFQFGPILKKTLKHVPNPKCFKPEENKPLDIFFEDGAILKIPIEIFHL